LRARSSSSWIDAPPPPRTYGVTSPHTPCSRTTRRSAGGISRYGATSASADSRGASAATMVASALFVASLAMLWPNMARRRLLLAVVLVSPAVLAAAGQAVRPVMDAINPPKRIIARQDGSSTCRAISELAPLSRLPRGRMIAPIDLGPGILAATDHSVFAGPYHRNNDGNLVMIRAMMAEPGKARRILGERQADYVVLCRGSLELKELLELAPDGLAARLGRGEVPDFLQPVTLTPSGNLTAWRVRP